MITTQVIANKYSMLKKALTKRMFGLCVWWILCTVGIWGRLLHTVNSQGRQLYMHSIEGQ